MMLNYIAVGFGPEMMECRIAGIWVTEIIKSAEWCLSFRKHTERVAVIVTCDRD